jgi:DNA-binding XRE family transcriptional regulator
MHIREYLFRHEKEFTHKEFAKKVGISRRCLNLIMAEQVDMRLSTAIKIEKASEGHVSIYDLYDPPKII